MALVAYPYFTATWFGLKCIAMKRKTQDVFGSDLKSQIENPDEIRNSKHWQFLYLRLMFICVKSMRRSSGADRLPQVTRVPDSGFTPCRLPLHGGDQRGEREATLREGIRKLETSNGSRAEARGGEEDAKKPESGSIPAGTQGQSKNGAKLR